MAKAKRWTDEELDKLQGMIDRGKPYKDIAEHYRIKVETLHKVICNTGIQGVGTGNVPKPRPSKYSREGMQCRL